MNISIEKYTAELDKQEVYDLVWVLEKYLLDDEQINHAKRFNGMETYKKNNKSHVQMYKLFCEVTGQAYRYEEAHKKLATLLSEVSP